jgi:hypothetical protein
VIRTERRDWISDTGTLVVGAAAAVLTFTTLRDLAEAVGIGGWLAWLVPVTVDVAGIVAARVWLRGQAPADAVGFARTLAWACIVGSVGGNAGQHAMAAYDLTAPWPVVVLVSAVPPAMLGAMVHLGHLTRRPTPTPTEALSDVLEIDAEALADPDPGQWWPAAPSAGEIPPAEVGEPGEPAGVDRVAELVASGLGRRRLAKALGIREHEARQLLASHRQEVAA